MHLILGLVIGFVGALELGVSGALLGGLIGVLVAEVLSLRKRLGILEKTALIEESPKKKLPRRLSFSHQMQSRQLLIGHLAKKQKNQLGCVHWLEDQRFMRKD